ncbi:exonuclease SbcCD subunit D [Methanocorpusculum vombati]|uniref:Nuclease SbcCD subunit D n=1 Tax=Methanocorpusculum vombati TaxID=3002864 RepID=A0ABT4ILG8_9EURY|nr:exonuclease SbcCD subunit D [Methanocorpusculum vombati]MCZ9320417.1 exonuclease SbcCD subunit D [Methanocorpusculum sp.]MCZ0862581.1 exonuclease SbcCD subunit D [Methanocorpusculum vombati]MDE2520977.1 exonuclease SbcCD subunit D [Methanocorpusculum sp.]MDE2533972.1 exonuclease SbcCD subunit D [Methanocorpusculum sp.]MDE2548092.1 exonuclease SbcCD subunit D [Methanocorpusculum sp.]
MKLIHTADLHLGKQLYGYSILTDQEFILNQIAETAVREHADGLIIAGDIFDTAVAGRTAIDLLNRFLTRLRDEKIAVFMISGNHDSPERIHYASDIMDSCGIHISGIYDSDRDIRIVDLHDTYGPLHICLLPYLDPASVRSSGRFPAEQITTFDDAVAAVLADIPFRPDERYVAVAHQFIAGLGTTPSSSESERIIVGGIEQVNANRFTEFEYVALGHLHKPQKVGLPTIRYAGSPLKYSPSECGTAKSVTLVEFFEKGNVTIRQIPLHPLHDLRIICGTLDDLTTDGAVPAPHDDYFAVQLTDPLPPADALARLRAVYPNIITLEMINDALPAAAAAGARMEDLRKSDRDLFAGFFAETTGRDLSTFQEQTVLAILQELEAEK